MGTFLGRNLVTPIVDPKDKQGRPLKP